MKERLHYLDNVKGIAILLVVLGHILPMQSNNVSVWLYSFHLPVFYIVTGILHSTYTDVKITFKEYALKKGNGTLYPYLAFSILAVALLFMIGLFRHNISAALNATMDTITLIGYSALWFLPSFLFSELLLFAVMKKQRDGIVLCSIIITSVVCAVMSMLNVSKTPSIIYSAYYFIGRIMIGFMFMMIGYYVKQFSTKHQMLQERNVLLVIGGLFLLIGAFTSQLNRETDIHFFILGNPVYFYFNAILGSYGVIFLSQAVFTRESPLTFLGRNSLVIMATHLPLPVLSVLGKVANVLGLQSKTIRYLFLFVSCILVEVVLVVIIKRYFPFLTNYNKLKTIVMRCKHGTDYS